MKSYIAILSSLVVALTPILATAQETETQDQRGITVAKKTSAAMPVTGTPKLVPQLGHSQQVVKGALSPDGRYALTGAGGDDSAAILWDAASGRVLRRFATGFSDFGDLAFVPDGRRVLVASTKSVFLYDISSGTEIGRFQLDEVNASGLDNIDVSPDGKRLLVATQWNNAPDYVWKSAGILYDIDTGQLLRRFNTNIDSHIYSVAFSPDGSRILTGGEQGQATLWDVETGQQLRTFVTQEKFVSPVVSLAFSPDGKSVLLGMASWTRNWRKGNTEHGKCEESNGGYCTTLFDVETGESIRKFRLASAAQRDVSISSDGTVVRSRASRTQFKVETGEEVIPVDGRVKSENGFTSAVFDFSGDGTQLLTYVCIDNCLESVPILWDLKANKELQRFQSRGATSINSVNWSKDGSHVLTSDANKAYLWDLAAGKLVQQYAEPLERLSMARPRGNYYDYFATPVERAILSPDNRHVLTVGSEGRAILWNAATGAQERRLAGHKGPVFAGDISPDGRLVATGGDDKTVRLWDLESGRQLASWQARWAVVDLEFSADGALLAAGTFENSHNSNGQVLVWDVATRKARKGFSGKPLERPTMAVAFSPDGKGVISGGWDYLRGWDINNGELAGSHAVVGVTDIAFSPDGTRVLLQSEDGGSTVALHESENGDVILKVQHDGPVNALDFSPDGQWFVTGSSDRTTRIWNAESGDEEARLIAFADGSYAAIDPEGRFDASNGGEVDGLHWVAGLEPIALSQLKSRYYEPGLLAKILGLSDEPLRQVESLAAADGVELFPEVLVTQAPTAVDRSLKLQLRNRGGGIGRVAIFVNGKEVAEDARATGANSQAEQLDVVVDLTDNKFFIAGKDNQIEVVAYNADNYLASPRVRISVGPMSASIVEKPQLWAIVAGVSDYVGAGLDLRFAAKDAEDFATALTVASERLLGPERVHVTHLYDGKAPATRANLRAAFDSIKRAKPDDILVLYLAGHGTSYGGQEGDYYYLLQEAENGDLSNPAVRAQIALSSQELTEWIKEIPALKQVLILDTCHAGQLITDLTKTRGLPSAELRSLDRMKDRTGMFIIAGSAADAVSYEASRYGQGVLTYSLLEGMRGAALRENAFVDVGQLLTYAVDRVPALARGIGGIQQPRMATPAGGESFDMGWLPAATDLAKIPIAEERPLLLKTSFTPEDQPLDVLDLTPMVNEALRARAADPRNAPFVFVEADQSAGAWRVAGRYGVVGTTVTLKVYLYQDKSVAAQFDVQGQTGTLAVLTAEIVRQVEARVKP